MKSFLKEFKEFAVKGNVMDLAVGLIIGAAFNKVISSLVTDVILPPIGLVLNKVNFANLFVNLGGGTFTTVAEAQAAGAPTLNYGLFIDTIISFVVTAFVVFLVVRQMNAIRRRADTKKEPLPPSVKECHFCFSTIPVKASRCPHCTSVLA